MKIAKLESLHCDAGTRNFDFLKLTTDTGLVGWSEYNETFGGAGLAAVIDRLAPSVIGKDPRAWEAHVTLMYAIRRQASGGVEASLNPLNIRHRALVATRIVCGASKLYCQLAPDAPASNGLGGLARSLMPWPEAQLKVTLP